MAFVLGEIGVRRNVGRKAGSDRRACEVGSARSAHVVKRRGASVVRMVNTEVQSSGTGVASTGQSRIGLVGLAVMGQNLALNVADKGFPISVYNRTASKTDDAVERAGKELQDPSMFRGYHDLKEFVQSIERPRSVIMLVKAGKPVDATIDSLIPLLDEGDLIIDGGNEWHENTTRRSIAAKEKGILYMGMGVSGGEEGARNGPSLMPGGAVEAYQMVEPVLKKVAAQVGDFPCVTLIGPGGAGNYVKMIHNGIEYGDMQLIGEAYDILRNVGGLTHDELADVFTEWNEGALKSFLIEITAQIMRTKDDLVSDGGALVDRVVDMTGAKGTGMWTMEEAIRRGVASPTIAASLDARNMSGLKTDRVAAEKVLKGPSPQQLPAEERSQLIKDVERALYASKVCSYAQGMNLIKKAGLENDWNLKLGEIASIWREGCIIRAQFLGRITEAYDRDADLPSLLVDPEFAQELADAQEAWRNTICLSIKQGISVPAFSASLAYYDAYRRGTMQSSQLVQAQRDFFGAHTYKRLDMEGKAFHTRWSTDGVTEEQ